MAAEKNTKKTTRPEAKLQRDKAPEKTTENIINEKLDAFPDRIDVRDWIYQPTLMALPTEIINCDRVPCILDQKNEGACTGFALAAIINFQLTQNGRCIPKTIEKLGASPRMLYEMARRHDEWPGENYSGSSARGTVKGWVAHGVVDRETWPDELKGHEKFDDDKAKKALNFPAGAYYRVMHRNIRDMHAALQETGILFATMMVHTGWNDPKENLQQYTYTQNGKQKKITLPVIKREDRATGGHAIAIVGYVKDGFIIQNSWGSNWGSNGFAVLPYEDWLLHSSDCWVVQMGVPINVDLWNQANYADTASGKQRASEVVPLEQIRPYVINIGNNGFLSDSGQYWTTEADILRMFQLIYERSATWKKKRIMLYLHGGLNSEKEVAKRVISYKQVCLNNEIYPVHIMWETDVWNTLKSDVFDIFTKDDRAEADWLNKFREGTMEILDRTFELTASKPGSLLWNEMKENARLASIAGRAMDFLAKSALKAFQDLNKTARSEWELHIVAHSAGAIFTAHAIDALIKIGVPVKSVHFMAPAISIQLFKNKLLKLIEEGLCPLPVLYILSDAGERDDNIGPYGKSLLYLVSNSFEEKRETPILGMEKFINPENKELNKGDNKKYIDTEIGKLYKTKTGELTNMVISGAVEPDKTIRPDISRSETHGGFDNDPFTLNSVLYRILGKAPAKGNEFTVRDLQF